MSETRLVSADHSNVKTSIIQPEHHSPEIANHTEFPSRTPGEPAALAQACKMETSNPATGVAALPSPEPPSLEDLISVWPAAYSAPAKTAHLSVT